MIHLEDSASAGRTLCGECRGSLDDSHTIVAFGQIFTCEGCMRRAQQLLGKFTSYERETITTYAHGRGFQAEFEQLARGRFSIASRMFDIGAPVLMEHHHQTALQAAIGATKLLVRMYCDNLRRVAIDANGVDMGGTRRALERVNAALDLLKRWTLLLEDLRALEASFPEAMIEKEDKS